MESDDESEDVGPAPRMPVDSVEFTRALVAGFGGQEEYAAAMAEEFSAAPPGSHVRATILKMIQNSVQEATRVSDGRNDSDDLDQLSDQQLNERRDLMFTHECFVNPEKWRAVCDRVIAMKADPVENRKVNEELWAIEAKLA